MSLCVLTAVLTSTHSIIQRRILCEFTFRDSWSSKPSLFPICLLFDPIFQPGITIFPDRTLFPSSDISICLRFHKILRIFLPILCVSHCPFCVPLIDHPAGSVTAHSAGPVTAHSAGSVTVHSVCLLLSILRGLLLPILLSLLLSILCVSYCPFCVSVTVHSVCQLLSILCASYCPFCGVCYCPFCVSYCPSCGVCYCPLCWVCYCPFCVSVTVQSVCLLLPILRGLLLPILRVSYCPSCGVCYCPFCWVCYCPFCVLL